MTTKIGIPSSEVTVADPVEDYSLAVQVVGSSQRALDGTRLRHGIAVKTVWQVKWQGLTTAQGTALTAELERLATLNWIPPTGGTYSVQCDGYEKRAMTGSTWEITASLEQV